MTVAEFAEVWSCHYKYNIEVRFTYKGIKKTLYNLHKIYEELNNFTIEISLENLNEDHLFLYSDDYDLTDLNLQDNKIFESLKIKYPDSAFKHIITIHII
jgi:hypothetical protein